MELKLTDLTLQDPKGPGQLFIPTIYQEAIAHCFEQPDARLVFLKEARQIGLTTILAACVAREFLHGKSILFATQNHYNKVVFNRMVDGFHQQFVFKDNPDAKPERTGSWGSKSIVYAINNLNLYQHTNSRSFDLVVIDEARIGENKNISQFSFLYPVLNPGASILIFGA